MKPFATLVAITILSFSGAASSDAQPFETRAKQALLVEADSGAILFSKQPDQPFPPASLAKLMTMEIVFHALRAGDLSIEKAFVISENAWRTGGAPAGGSTMFAKLNSQVALGDLIQGVIVQSANDGCIAIAEGMAGSEQAFATLMNKRARDIGLQASNFRNATGLPADGQTVTARDLVRLAMHLWRTYPVFYRTYAQKDFTWNGITQRNRNPLLAMDIGADGLATGYTEESGYAIVGSVSRDGRRLFAVLSGLASERERAEEARKLFGWGISSFTRVGLFGGGEIVGEAVVFGGEKSVVMLKAAGPVSITVPTADRDSVTARIVYDGPVAAPVEEGAPVGALKVWIGDQLSQETPLFAAETVGFGAIHQRAYDAIAELLTGWLRKPASS